MSIIFADDINDNRGDDLSKRVDTIYDYIAYMKEQLEFWARNRTREISGADAKIDSAIEDIAENTDAIADLEPRIQVYEDNLPIDGTGITAHKPLLSTYNPRFTSSDDLNNIPTNSVIQGFVDNAQNKPSGSKQYGWLSTGISLQTFYEFDTQNTSPSRVYVRGYVNDAWTPWQQLGDSAYQYWIYKGKLIQGIGASVAGYGTATISCTNGLYRVDFSAQITAKDSSQYWDWGIDRDFLTATIGKTIRFVTGGNWLSINSSGALIPSDINYGTCVYPRYSNRFAGFGRMYQTDGSDGLWASNHFAVGTILQGVAYATL